MIRFANLFSFQEPNQFHATKTVKSCRQSPIRQAHRSCLQAEVEVLLSMHQVYHPLSSARVPISHLAGLAGPNSILVEQDTLERLAWEVRKTSNHAACYFVSNA